MSISAIPQSVDGESILKENGVYIQFSREYEFLNEDLCEQPYWYNILFVKRCPVDDKKYLFTIGGNNSLFWYPSKCFEKLVVKKCRRETERFYVFEPCPDSKHVVPEIDDFHWYDESVDGCRCFTERMYVCSCDIQELNKPTSNDECNCCIQCRKPHAKQTAIHSVVSSNLCSFLGIEDPQDSVKTALTLQKLPFEKLFSLFHAWQYTSPIKNEYATADWDRFDSKVETDHEHQIYKPQCDEIDNSKVLKMLQDHIKSETRMLNMEEFEELLEKLHCDWKAYRRKNVCNHCQKNCCFELVRNFILLYWTEFCELCERNTLIHAVKYNCQECPDYNICQSCYRNKKHGHHQFTKMIVTVCDGKFEFNEVLIAHAKSTREGDDFYIRYYGDSNLIVPEFYRRDVAPYYFFPHEADAAELCVRRKNNWVELSKHLSQGNIK